MNIKFSIKNIAVQNIYKKRQIIIIIIAVSSLNKIKYPKLHRIYKHQNKARKLITDNKKG